jgi:shikimate dehydrogenase
MAAGEPQLGPSRSRRGAGPAGRAAVVGHPIAHSLSPALHRAAYHELGLDWTYEAIDVDEQGLSDLVPELGAPWRGLSVTMPLKRAIMAYCGEVTPLAAAVEAVNTVVIGPDQKWRGDNTDVPGMVTALDTADAGSPASMGVLGGGATASAAVAAAAALSCPVMVAVRSPHREAEIARVAAATGANVRVVGWQDVAQVMRCDVVISAVPAAGSADLATAVPTDAGLLFDVVYDPWPTPLARAWPVGQRVLGGLDLLVHQAVLQVELMCGRRPSWEPMRQAGIDVLVTRQR